MTCFYSYDIYVLQMTTTDVFGCSHNPVFLSSFMTYNRILNRVTRWVSLVEKEILSLPKHQILSLLFRGVHVAQSSVFCVELCRPLFVISSRFFWPLYYLSFDLLLWYIFTLFLT